MTKRILLLCCAFALTIASPALASRPSLTQDRADAAAERLVNSDIDGWNEVYDPTLPQGWQTQFVDGDEYFFYNVTATGYELDPCDLEGRYRAECAATLWMSDGGGCDEIIDVTMMRRGRVIAESEVSCDGDGIDD